VSMCYVRSQESSDTREQKRAWLTTIREVLVFELNSAIADKTEDDAFKARCRSLLDRIPNPYW